MPVGLLAWIYAGPFLSLWIGNRLGYDAATWRTLMRLFLLAAIPLVLSVFVQMSIGLNKIKVIALSALAGSAVNLPISCYLTARLGVSGRDLGNGAHDPVLEPCSCRESTSFECSRSTSAILLTRTLSAPFAGGIALVVGDLGYANVDAGVLPRNVASGRDRCRSSLHLTVGTLAYIGGYLLTPVGRADAAELEGKCSGAGGMLDSPIEPRLGNFSKCRVACRRRSSSARTTSPPRAETTMTPSEGTATGQTRIMRYRSPIGRRADSERPLVAPACARGLFWSFRTVTASTAAPTGGSPRPSPRGRFRRGRRRFPRTRPQPGRRGVVRSYDELIEDLLQRDRMGLATKCRGVPSLRARALERRAGRAPGGAASPGKFSGVVLSNPVLRVSVQVPAAKLKVGPFPGPARSLGHAERRISTPNC